MKKKQPLEIPPAFRSAADWAFSEILQSGGHLERCLDEALEPFGVSSTQYSALRILRGAEEGLSCSDIGARMTTRDTDVTRLVDRLGTRGLVERSRDARDRRVVRVRLTTAGAELMDRIGSPTLELMEGCFAGIKPKRIRRLIEVLRELREAAPG